MEQVLHIFRKDVKHLWRQALIVLLLMLAHAVFAVLSLPVNLSQESRANTMLYLLNMLLPMGICFLIAWLVFQEALADDGQFWLTRPYSWPKLLASKVLFMLVFISVPLFLSDCCILAVQGLPVLGVLPALLLRQLLLAALFVLPSFTIATLTAGVTQFLLAWFILLLVLVFEVMAGPLLSLSGVSGFRTVSWGFIAALVVITSGLALWQYSERRTGAARLVLLTVTCAFLPIGWATSFPPHSSPIASQRRQSPNPPGVQITYDLDRSIAVSQRMRAQGWVLARIPLRAVGLPPKTLLRGSARAEFNAHGTVWPPPGGYPAGSGVVEWTNDAYWQTLSLEVSGLDILKQRPLHLQSSLDLEIVSDEAAARWPVAQRSFDVPGWGRCQAFRTLRFLQLGCRAGLTPSYETDLRLESNNGPGSRLAVFAPLEIPWGLTPTSDLAVSIPQNTPPNSELQLIPRHKIAVFQRTLDWPNIQVDKYLVDDYIEH